MAIQGPTICRKVDCCVENTLGLTHILCFLLALKEGLVQTIRAILESFLLTKYGGERGLSMVPSVVLLCQRRKGDWVLLILPHKGSF